MKTKIQLLLALLFFSQAALTPAAPAVSEALPPRVVIVLAVDGKLEASTDGKKFHRVRKGATLSEGTVVRVEGAGHADLFFRRIGTMVRLMPKTELKIETLKWRRNSEGVVVKDTTLDLRKGRVFAFVRVLFPESKFQVRTEMGLATLKGSGTGRYDIGADGRFVVGKSSRSSLKVIIDGNERVVDPGNIFNAREKRVSPLAPSDSEMLIIEIDELQSLAEQLTPAPTQDELPKK